MLHIGNLTFFKSFCNQYLRQACDKGEDGAKSIVSTMAPNIENELKNVNRWEKPHLAI